MSYLLNGFHPTFDALSAFADLADIDAAGTRIARHVVRCAACTATVADIRALGEAARGCELPGAPAGLWAAIERERDHPRVEPAPERPAPRTDVFTTTPALRPTTHVPAPLRRGLRRGAIALAAAAAVLALLLTPTSRAERLEAGSLGGTWRFSPTHPAAGATVTVRYEPAADERTPRQMLLLAGFARPRGDRSGRYLSGINRLQDSLAMLQRQPDGSYAGRFVLPDDFSAAVLRLADSTGRVRDRIMTTDGPVSRSYEPIALLVGGDARGTPSLASLTSALDLWSGNRSASYVVSDTLIKYFPAEPIGHASALQPPSRNLLDGLVAWFGSGERQYARWDERLMKQARVSLDHAVAMIWFSHRIAEPAETYKWTMRLAREHPEDPRALAHLGSMMNSMLSRHATSDSVRALLPLADSLWERNGHKGAPESLMSVASTIREPEAYRRWTMRAMQAGERNWRGDVLDVDQDALYDAEIRAAATPRLRERAGAACRIPPGKYSLWDDRDGWMRRCTAARAGAYGGLSLVARLDRNLPRALALADTSIALMQSTNGCWMGGSRKRRGEALLAMGDAQAAARELAWSAGGGNWQSDAYRDSVGRVLRPAVDSAQWHDAIRRANEAQAACLAELTARNRARATAAR